jgi:hypothetical protein
MSDHDNRHEKAVSEKPAKQLSPRQRRQALLSLGLVECRGPCCRVLPVEQMSKRSKDRYGSRCRQCESARLRELRARPPKTAPDGPPLLTAPVIRGEHNPEMERALAFARVVLRSTRSRS